MTSWPEEPPTGQPQTRRQAREFARRAGTAQPTPGGQVPEMTTSSSQRTADGADAVQPDEQESVEAPAIPASAFAEPGVSSPSRDAFDLFRQAPDASRPEPVTQPMAILQTPDQQADAPATPAPAAAPAFPERTLTRRELRAMQQAQQANAQANHPAGAEEQVFPVSFTSGPEAESGASTGEAPKPAAAPQNPETSTSEKTAWPFAPLTPSSAPAAARAGADEPTVTQSTASPFAAFGATAAPKPTTPQAPEPAPAAQASETPAASAAPAAATSEDTAAQERRPFTPPTGHWSTAAELDDQHQPITSRNVAQSTAATTTNALILPAIPQPSAAPLTSTGEILVTGSIDLPRGMGATGAHPDRIDSSDIDRLLDGEENEFNTSEVQPVRASRAISTHTSTRGVIAPPKKRGNALPVVLMVTAGVLAVGVIGLLVAAYVLKVF
ncbi:hypothetical protein [Leifsonia sp. C5G2]|uniref:hypothetical protein n=1 Tax=Leifsonia sp. C5G2 TaxID=2735269 RepID=UPI00201CA172|nr:hypothetical protein [Leifsonia sp. C5G2]